MDDASEDVNLIDEIESGNVADWVVGDDGEVAGGEEIGSASAAEYGGANEDNDIDLVVVGGEDDTELAYVCDDSAYYINLRRVELAQFEASKPTAAQIAAKFQTMFGYMMNSKRLVSFKHIINQSQTKQLVYQQLSRLAGLIDRLNELLVVKVMQAAAAGNSAALSVSLPDIDIIPSIDRGLIYDTLVMDSAIEAILQYMRELNVDPLLKSPLKTTGDWTPMEKGPRYKPGIEESMDIRTKTIANMHKLLDAEAHIIAQIRNIEKFHHRVLIRVGMVQAHIGKIMDLLA